MKRFASFAIVLVVLLSGSLWAGQLKPEEKRALESKPAVALVQVILHVKYLPGVPAYAFEEIWTEAGTGFFFRPDGYLLTNGHVVADANPNNNQAVKARQEKLLGDFIEKWKSGEVFARLEAKMGGGKLTDADKQQLLKEAVNELSELSQGGKSGPLLPVVQGPPEINVILQNGKSVKADIMQFSPPDNLGGKDVAVLKIPGNNLPTVPLGNSDNVRLQDAIMVMGYPGVASNWGGMKEISEESNLEPSATDGHISALKTEVTGTPLLQSDVAITHGNSGGPAFNDQGEVIGLATLGAQATQGFNFLVPINTALEFVRQTGAAPATGDFNKHWNEALNLYDEGKCNQAIAEFDNVGQFMPGLRDAQKYRGAAVACADQMSWLQKLTETTGKWPLLALLAIVILGGGTWLAMSGPGAAKGAAKSPAAKGAGAGQGAFGRIQFSSGSLSGRTFPIGKEGLWIGRDSAKCAVVVQDDSVSSQHAWVVPADGNIMVIDKDSTNGTYVNSVDSPRISKVGLRNGDRVFLGQKGAVFTYFAA
jgi:S1-C subfamily serine protease